MKPITDKTKYGKFINEIIKHIQDNYEGTLDMCGENDELTSEAKELFEKVITNPVEECEQDIETYFQSIYECVGGEIDKYYDIETVQLFKDLAYLETT